jgi:nitrite reductase (cytochrome c-552)
MATLKEVISRKPWIGWLLFLATVAVVFLLGILASSIVERRSEAKYAYRPPTDLQPFETDNSVWGKFYPREYETWMKTADTSFHSKYAGSKPIDALETDPEMVILWAGYAFSKDYSQARGHWYAVQDIRNTLRTGSPMTPEAGPQPGTCWACKSPDVPRMIDKMGAESFYKATWASLGPEITSPIGCGDCHNPDDMTLTITRPALKEAFERQGKNVTDAGHQEMRSLVCAQCHVEYYFKGEGKYLTFPWDNGMTVSDIESYYDSYAFSDWTHAISKAPMLKAQHPDYELYRMGIHGQRGVACADCHMPYIAEGGVKYTSHHVRSPLASISTTCAVCHRQSEEELLNNVYDRQDKIAELRNQLEVILVSAHYEAKAARDAGASEEKLKPALTMIRQAQWRWDFTAASHGASFHAPLEVASILGNGIIRAMEARIELASMLKELGVNEVTMPDISSKANAQKTIGLDMEKLIMEKEEFRKQILPGWDKSKV